MIKIVTPRQPQVERLTVKYETPFTVVEEEQLKHFATKNGVPNDICYEKSVDKTLRQTAYIWKWWEITLD